MGPAAHSGINPQSMQSVHIVGFAGISGGYGQVVERINVTDPGFGAVVVIRNRC